MAVPVKPKPAHAANAIPPFGSGQRAVTIPAIATTPTPTSRHTPPKRPRSINRGAYEARRRGVAKRCSVRSIVGQQALRDDLVHDLVGAAADALQARVTEGPRDAGLLEIAGAAPDL